MSNPSLLSLRTYTQEQITQQALCFTTDKCKHNASLICSAYLTKDFKTVNNDYNLHEVTKNKVQD